MNNLIREWYNPAWTDDALSQNNLDIAPKHVGPDLSWPPPIYREDAHLREYPLYFVHRHYWCIQQILRPLICASWPGIIRCQQDELPRFLPDAPIIVSVSLAAGL